MIDLLYDKGSLLDAIDIKVQMYPINVRWYIYDDFGAGISERNE